MNRIIKKARVFRGAIVPDVRRIFTKKVSMRLGHRFGTSITATPTGHDTPGEKRKRQRRAINNTTRGLSHRTHLLPPPSGHRRPEFCGTSLYIWTPKDTINASL
jgi:hypothetical protein